MQGIMETTFDVIYLITVTAIGLFCVYSHKMSG